MVAIERLPNTYPCPTVQRWGIRGTNFHDYWDCSRCGLKWTDGPPKTCGMTAVDDINLSYDLTDDDLRGLMQ